MAESESSSLKKHQAAFAEFGFGLFDLMEENENEDLPEIELETFLKENYNDIIVTFTQSNYKQLRHPLLILFHDFQLKGTKIWIDKLYEVALKFSDKIQFAVAKTLEDLTLFYADYEELFYLGFNGSIEPYVYAIDVDGRQHEYRNRFSIDDLTHYCEQLAKNELYRSDPTPIELDKEIFVDIICADNFRHFVENNSKDVFVTIHANFRYPYDLELWGVPRLLKADNNYLVFYAINAETNYIPLEYKSSQLPTSFLISRFDKGKHLRFVHNRYCKGELICFIAKNTSFEMETLDCNGREKYPRQNNYIQYADDLRQIDLNDILRKLTLLLEKKLPNKDDDDNGFFKFLNKILIKLNETDLDSVKIELITLASKRVNEILSLKEEKLT